MQKIIFTGKDSDAPKSLTIGRTEIKLPDNQKKTFTHKDAKLILRSFPELYKPVFPKGKKRKVKA